MELFFIIGLSILNMMFIILQVNIDLYFKDRINRLDKATLDVAKGHLFMVHEAINGEPEQLNRFVKALKEEEKENDK